MRKHEKEGARLTALARAAAAEAPDIPGLLCEAIDRAIASPADPWTLAGVLIAGMVQVVQERIPPEKQSEWGTAIALMVEHELRPTRAS